MTDSAINLYKLLGIDDTRFTEVITPIMDGLCSKGAPADEALLAIESSKLLKSHEKLYCAYAIGRVCAIEEIKSRIPAPMKSAAQKLFGR